MRGSGSKDDPSLENLTQTVESCGNGCRGLEYQIESGDRIIISRRKSRQSGRSNNIVCWIRFPNDATRTCFCFYLGVFV